MIPFKTLNVAPQGRSRSTISVCLAALALASSATADRIHLISGEPIEECTIVTETMSEVTYKESERGKSKTVPSANVLSVEFTSVPNDVQAADAAVKDQELGLAFDLFESYLTEHLEGRPERRKLWAPAYVAHRLIELNVLVGERADAIKAADLLIDKFPDSRYLPNAYMTKARVQAEEGDGDGAKETLEKLERLIIKQDLPKRFGLECGLFKILVDAELVGEARRTELRVVETDAGGEYPTVRNRATVAIGESFLLEASQGDGGAKALGEARTHFEDVIKDPSADDETLAGAYTGLGDCLFQVAATSKDEGDIHEALMTNMRVVVLYRDEVRYAPKAMFYAGRCFNLKGGPEDIERANKLYNRIIRNHDGTKWAAEARSFRK